MAAKGCSQVVVVAGVALSLLVLFLAVAVQPGQAAVDCGEARKRLAPCTTYLTGNLRNPPALCCNGVQYIKNNTKTKADRQATCQCLKDTATKIEKLKDSAAQQLPTKCKVPIDVPISRTVDCRTV